MGDYTSEIKSLQKENGDLTKRVDDLEELLTKVRKEITLMKEFEWGTRVDPPTIKKDIC